VVEATQDDLKRLLKRLDRDPEIAWESYLTVWQKLVKFFQHHNYAPAGDHAHEVLSRIARRDDLGDIRNVGAFAYGVARKMISEKPNRETSLEGLPEATVSNWTSGPIDPTDNIDRQRKLRCIQHCLERLPENERNLFLSFELADSETRVHDRSKLAAGAGVSAGALRVRAFRIRRDLERCAGKCLINWGKHPL
jgi:DNA-directed RNA polymerase specialized sigma24 family protein